MSVPHILYLVHDLADPAVRKRILMLQDGGARVTVAGFRRTTTAPPEIANAPVIDFGQTYNGGFIQRILSVFRILLTISRYQGTFAEADILIARTLEMLAIAVRGRAAVSSSATLVYEVLDIHRLMLKQNFMGRGLRFLEGWMSRRAACLITSSPAFIEQYFTPLSQVRLPSILLENKVYLGEETLPPVAAAQRLPGPPWRIGWFGALRCRKSLALLSDLVKRAEGKVVVVLRGRPAHDQFEDFGRDTTALPGLRFEGAYTYPDDLAEMYRNVHFSWAVDMFEEGLNSSWLLPNRIYEGGRYGVVPLALAGVEIGRATERLGIGVRFDRLTPDALLAFFMQLTSLDYRDLEETAMSISAQEFSFTRKDCTELVAHLCSFSKGTGHDPRH